MHILFVSSDFLPAIGGISLMVHGLAEACADLGHEVCVLAPGPEGEADSSLPYKVIRDTRPRPHRRQRVARLLYDRHTASRVRELVENIKPDAILLGVYKDYARACLLAGERFHIPVGGLVHGLDVISVLDRRPSGLLAVLGKTLGPSARRRVLLYLLHTDRIFVNSSVTSAHVERRCGRRPITIGCGVPGAVLSTTTGIERATVERPAIRARLGLKEAPTIGFLGRLIARKNVESILESLRTLPECNVLIVGDGPMRDSLQILAKELGVNERATFAGQVDEQSKWEHLRAMDVFCMPSKEVRGYNFEGFGIAFLEATVAGVPVVGGRSGGIPDVVVHEQTGLLADPNDWRDVARCLRRMLEDHELAAHCVYSAQTQLRDQFNWPVIARRVIDELRDASIEIPSAPIRTPTPSLIDLVGPAADHRSKSHVISYQGVECSSFDDLARFENENLIASPYGRQPVGDDYDRLPLCQPMNRVHDGAFGNGIEGACSFIKDKYLGIMVQSARDPDALTLTARQADSAFTDLGFVAVLQLARHEVMQMGDPGGTFDCRHVDLLFCLPEGNVGGNRFIRQIYRLGYIANHSLPTSNVLLRDGSRVDEHAPLLWPEEPKYDVDGRRLPGPGRSNQPYRASGGNAQGKAIQNRPFRTGIAVRDVLQHQFPAQRQSRLGSGSLGLGGRCQLRYIGVQAVQSRPCKPQVRQVRIQLLQRR